MIFLISMIVEFVKPEYKHSEITGKILAAAFEVHKVLGCGFSELVYHRALEVEFRLKQINFISEKEMSIFYKNEKVGTRRVDFFVEQVIPVEIKAISVLENRDLAQSINYLEAFNMEVGLLINFGNPSLQYKRLVHPRLLKNKAGLL